MVEFQKNKSKVFISGIDAVAKEVHQNKEDYMTRSLKKGSPVFLNEQIIRHRHQLSYKDAKLVKALVEQRINKASSKPKTKAEKVPVETD